AAVAGLVLVFFYFEETDIFLFSSRRRHTRFDCDWSSDVCSSDLREAEISTPRWREDPRPVFAMIRVALRGSARDAEPQLARAKRSEERRVGKEWRSWRGMRHW